MVDSPDKNQHSMQRKRRCPRLGHDIAFEYCLMSGEGDTICWKIFDCWWEIFDVETYLKANLPEEEYRRLAQKEPKNKVTSILEIMEAAKKRTGRDPGE